MQWRWQWTGSDETSGFPKDARLTACSCPPVIGTGISSPVSATGLGARGDLIPDAYLAALAIESGAEWVTTDRDYARFPGLQPRHLLD
jgi:predicted nucleic acid-binding protein